MSLSITKFHDNHDILFEVHKSCRWKFSVSAPFPVCDYDVDSLFILLTNSSSPFANDISKISVKLFRLNFNDDKVLLHVSTW